MRFFNNKTKIFCDIATSTHKDAVVAGALLVLASKFNVSDYYGISNPVGVSKQELVLEEFKHECVDFIQVIVRCDGINHVMLWNRKGYTTSFIWEVRKKFLSASITLQLGGKPIREDVLCSEYDVHEGSIFTFYRPRLGGCDGDLAKMVQPMVKMPWDISFGDRAKKFQMMTAYGKYTLKGNTEVPYIAIPKYSNGKLFYAGKSQLGFDIFSATQRLAKQTRSRCKMQSNNVDLVRAISNYVSQDTMALIEDSLILFLQLLKARDATDKILALTTFVKLRTGLVLSTLVANAISDVVNMSGLMQSEDDILNSVSDLRSLIMQWETLKDNAVVRSTVKLYRYAIAMGVFAAVGVQVDETVLYTCKKECSGILAGPNFLVAIIDFITLVLQRVLLFRKTGSWHSLIHGPTSFGTWYEQCSEVKRLFSCRNDLEAQGSNYHEFVNKLDDSIETGRNILKFGNSVVGVEVHAVKRLLGEMLMLKSDVASYKEAQRSRRPPFSLLLFGKTCVAKSTFTEMLYQFTGRIMNLPTSEEFKYSRNPCDDFWSGWDSSKWCVILDDVAYVNPNANQQDNSLMEIIQLVNDIALVPNQAHLDDKGRNPVRARAVFATTNVKHLNAFAHFACPAAVQRRLPFVVTVEPKRDYARDDDPDMIDPAKLPTITTEWPDFWNISVERVVTTGNGMATFNPVQKFSDIEKFLKWLASAIRTFEMIQAKAKAGCEAMREFVLCKNCDMLIHKCSCEMNRTMQAREYSMPNGRRVGDSFVTTESEDGVEWEYRYDYHRGDGYNYILTTIRKDVDGMTRKTVTQVELKDSNEPELQVEEVAMAECLAEIVRRQALEAQLTSTTWMTWMIEKTLNMYCKSSFFRTCVNKSMEYTLVQKCAMWAVKYINTDSKAYLEWCGELTQSIYISRKWKYVLGGLAAASSMLMLYSIWKPSNTVQEPNKEVQGARLAVPDEHFVKSEKENVWKRDDYEVSSFDMHPLNIDYKALPFDQLTKLIRRNVARIRVSNGVRVREGNAFCVGGHLWVTNAHTFFTDAEFKVSLSKVPFVEGTSPNVTFTLRNHEMYWDTQRDQVWFQVFCWETKRDLRKLIAKPTLTIKGKGVLVGYTKEIAETNIIVDAVTRQEAVTPIYDSPIMGWSGWSRSQTVKGDCGMPLVTFGEPCVAIVGLHMMATETSQVWSTGLTTDLVDAAVSHFGRPILQCRAPEISAPSKVKKCTGLRPYSPLRWVESGSLNVYGSFDEYQPTSRSKVRKTLLSDIIIKERGWEVDAAAPQLNDWRPWRHALVDVVQQNYGAVDTHKLQECARAFVDDILEGLTKEDLDTIQVLSDKATINGIDGVKYIDKMNFKSSMGEPYRQQKKHFLSGPIGDKMFCPEVQERIDNIISGYTKGICAAPIFSGQLKDEVRSKVKVDAGKVRVFMGGAADWCFVTRKFFLTTVKLIQEHPFLFEASPGCAAQSAEWEQYYEFLTQFGYDRIVAGDYGKFDKKMEAIMILTAFWILIQIHRAAGWTDEECLPLWCIAEDTAYAFCNFGGDLVQFFGSNPSGHPLTVIINCLVNALYMRYCFVTLCPISGDIYGKARLFKVYIALLTYGDDNTMGVSKTADWFNHTQIQKVLASIGVEYTMADKTSESVPFIHIRDVGYLKRKWRWDEDIGAVVCPLEESSIHKMLTYCVPSGDESEEFHMASVIVSAINEWFWYGKERFERERTWLLRLAEGNGIAREVATKNPPTWQQAYDRYWSASQGVITKRSQGCFDLHPRDVVA